jgi:hypothetical protein
MSSQDIDSIVQEQGIANNQSQITGTSTPAEDVEEQRAQDIFRDLKEDAKWGKDADTQKKAIRGLSKMGTPALSSLMEILLVLIPGEIKSYCQDAIEKLDSLQQSEMKKNTKTIK